MKAVPSADYDPGMLSSNLAKSPPSPTETPVVCPVCWDHSVERVEGVKLTARSMGGGDLSQVIVYRCAHWHLFALFQQPKAWE